MLLLTLGAVELQGWQGSVCSVCPGSAAAVPGPGQGHCPGGQRTGRGGSGRAPGALGVAAALRGPAASTAAEGALTGSRLSPSDTNLGALRSAERRRPRAEAGRSRGPALLPCGGGGPASPAGLRGGPGPAPGAVGGGRPVPFKRRGGGSRPLISEHAGSAAGALRRPAR